MNSTIVANAMVIGGKKFANIPVASLVIDKGYQRPLREKIYRMVSGWDYCLCDVVLVSYRDGMFYVVDGQHRVEAARRQTKETREFLPCQILEGLTREEEAKRFVALNTSQNRLSPYDSWNANLLVNDPVDTTIKRICSEWGVEVYRTQGHTYNRLGSLSTARNIVRRQGADCLSWIFNVIYKAQWHLILNGYSAIMMRALKTVWVEHRGGNDELLAIAVASVLKDHTHNNIMASAQERYREFPQEDALKKYLNDMVWIALANHNTKAAGLLTA